MNKNKKRALTRERNNLNRQLKNAMPNNKRPNLMSQIRGAKLKPPTKENVKRPVAPPTLMSQITGGVKLKSRNKNKNAAAKKIANSAEQTRREIQTPLQKSLKNRLNQIRTNTSGSNSNNN